MIERLPSSSPPSVLRREPEKEDKTAVTLPGPIDFSSDLFARQYWSHFGAEARIVDPSSPADHEDDGLVASLLKSAQGHDWKKVSGIASNPTSDGTIPVSKSASILEGQ